MDASYTDPSSRRRSGAQPHTPVYSVVESTTSGTRGPKRASESHNQHSTPKRHRSSAREPGPDATPHTPSDTTRSPASAVRGSACAYLLVGGWRPRSFPVSLDTILVE
ncbi:hypothetical protein C7999DRAFT_36480, partial [Corynascus novoguineensis]